MEVTCEHCNAHLNIPDDKLPPNRRVAINCPKCKNKITIDTSEPEPGQNRMDPPPQPETGKTSPEISEDEVGRQDNSVLDIFEEGKKLALLMGREATQNERFRSAARALGYQCLVTESAREAVGKLRFHHFDLIILADGFDGSPVAESPILAYLNGQAMSVRRRIFLALVGDGFKSTDNMMAYALSANVVINEKDLDKLDVVLKTAIAENEKFYKVFMDTLVELGKA